MVRFFIPTAQIEGNRVYLYGKDQHHLVKVLRKRIGDEFSVLNGKGEEFTARIVAMEEDRVTAEIVSASTKPAEPRVRITLAQSLPKADKFELIIQKNTEIGVSSFQPLITERSTIKLDRNTEAKKRERWQKIIQEAAEQSGRKMIPRLEPVKSWEDILADLGTGLAIIPWEGERQTSLKQVLEGRELPETVTILIGPEGGFSLYEVDRARAAGAIPVTLGPRILRTETAGLVVSTVIFYHYGDLS